MRIDQSISVRDICVAEFLRGARIGATRSCAIMVFSSLGVTGALITNPHVPWPIPLWRFVLAAASGPIFLTFACLLTQLIA